jgi:preprotein translocase subunit SecG
MQVLNIFHVLIAIALVAFVLIQKGQGATAGAAFGSGASGTVFGSRGAGSFLTRTTWVLAALFCSISLTMAVIVSRSSAQPENDLGVVGSSQPAPAVQSPVEENVISVGSEDSEGSDLPSFETATDEVSGSQLINSNAADDLPALDSTATEASENAVTKEVQAVEDGSGGEGSGSDDS